MTIFTRTGSRMGNCCESRKDSFHNLAAERHGNEQDPRVLNQYATNIPYGDSNAPPAVPSEATSGNQPLSQGQTLSQDQISSPGQTSNQDQMNTLQRPLPAVPMNRTKDLNSTYWLPKEGSMISMDSTYLKPVQNTRSKLLVASIDFGTTYSGFAYASKGDQEEDPRKVFVVKFKNGNTETSKAPSVVLFKPDKSFYKFGYEAENFYCNNEREEDLSQYYYFKHFKMHLYQDKKLSRDTHLTDITGEKSLPAVYVFSAVIRHFMDKLNGILTNHGFKDTDIFYVLTVPAIWNLKAKQFMRLAAEKAGISQENLAIALEPEAATMTCRYESRCSSKLLSPGQQYLVVDVGGGTLDITAHEILSDHGLKELHSAEGGAWGGMKVNEKFQEFLVEVFGPNVIREIRQNEPGDFVDFLTDFEKKKCFNADFSTSSVWVTLRIPEVFKIVFEKGKSCSLEEYVAQKFNKTDVVITKDKMKISILRFHSFYEECVNKVIQITDDLLDSSELKSIDTLLIVGGFAKSPILIKALKKRFKRYDVISPEDPETAILSGAVIFGFHPNMIQSRVCRYTYGIAKQEPFRDDIHPENKRKVVRGMPFCDDLFDKHVERGQKVELGVFLPFKEYSPVVNEQTHAGLELYASTAVEPMFITDESCEFIGIVEINLTPGLGSQDRIILVSMNISGTEIEIMAKEKQSNTVTMARCNFLG